MPELREIERFECAPGLRLQAHETLSAVHRENMQKRLDRIEQAPELVGYFAQFSRGATRPDPKDIVPCTGQKSASDADNGQANG